MPSDALCVQSDSVYSGSVISSVSAEKELFTLTVPNNEPCKCVQSRDKFELSELCSKNNSTFGVMTPKSCLYTESLHISKIINRELIAYSNIHKISPIFDYAISTRAP